MWYAYFRFYVGEDDIRSGLDSYCKEWENMFAVGYNYKEYKCFVDNLGGFEHWVGDMSGYISQDREVGFLDAAPSDAVYDPTVIMGRSRMIAPRAGMLHCVAPCSVIIRKILATAAAEGNIEIRFSTIYIVEHALYGAYDESKIERMVYSEKITDESTANYSITMDLSNDKRLIPTIDSSARILNPEKSINGFYNDYATFQEQKISNWIIYDFGAPIHLYNITGKIRNMDDAHTTITWKFYGSNDKADWTQIYSKAIPPDQDTWLEDYQQLDVTYRYIKITPTGDVTDNAHLFQLNFGIY